jgi:hypothetical protein
MTKKTNVEKGKQGFQETARKEPKTGTLTSLEEPTTPLGRALDNENAWGKRGPTILSIPAPMVHPDALDLEITRAREDADLAAARVSDLERSAAARRIRAEHPEVSKVVFTLDNDWDVDKVYTYSHGDHPHVANWYHSMDEPTAPEGFMVEYQKSGAIRDAMRNTFSKQTSMRLAERNGDNRILLDVDAEVPKK